MVSGVVFRLVVIGVLLMVVFVVFSFDRFVFFKFFLRVVFLVVGRRLLLVSFSKFDVVEI